MLEAEIRGLEAALVPIRTSPTKPISAAEKAAVDTDYEKLKGLLRGRRKQFNEFWGTICDGCGDMNPSDLWVSQIMITLLVLLLVNAALGIFSTELCFQIQYTAPSISTIALFYFIFPKMFTNSSLFTRSICLPLLSKTRGRERIFFPALFVFSFSRSIIVRSLDAQPGIFLSHVLRSLLEQKSTCTVCTYTNPGNYKKRNV